MVVGVNPPGPEYWRQKQAEWEALSVGRAPVMACYHPFGWGHSSPDWRSPVEPTSAFTSGVSREEPGEFWFLQTSPIAEDVKRLSSAIAVVLGSPDAPAAWQDWLDHLRRHSADYRETSMVGWLDGANPLSEAELCRVATGDINDVCAASARFCWWLALESEKPSPGAGDQSTNAAGLAVSTPKRRRGEWLKREMQARKIYTTSRMETLGGPAKKTVQRILDGLLVRETTALPKLIDALNYDTQYPPLKIEDIPRD